MDGKLFPKPGLPHTWPIPVLHRVVEDDAERVTVPGAQPADAVAHVDAVGAAGALDRAVVDGEDHPVALAQWHDLGAGLHARPLFGEHDFATSIYIFQ